MNAFGSATVGSAFVPRHSTEEEYAAFLAEHGAKPSSVKTRLQDRKRFVRAYPTVEDWFAAPLAERVGRLCGKARGTYVEERYVEEMTSAVSYKGRSYLIFLATAGFVGFDWE